MHSKMVTFLVSLQDETGGHSFLWLPSVQKTMTTLYMIDVWNHSMINAYGKLSYR